MNAASIRLCVVNPFQHGGGAEYQIGLLLAALRRDSRFDIHYLAHHVDDSCQANGYRVVRIGRSARVPPFGYITDFLPLYGALRRLRPQVIYQRVACGYTGICALYARRHDARLIWHVSHDTDVTEGGLDAGRNLVRRRLEKASIEFGLRRAARIVVQTQHQDRLLADHYGRAADEIVPNFDVEPPERIEKSAPPLVAWVANLKAWKRPEVFIRLATALRDIPEARFVMIGDAPTAPRDAAWLQSLRQAIAAVPNLTYLGHRSQAEVNELLARASIFVNTSLYEGFPNTFIQAWMRDTVVVSLDVNPDRVLDLERVGVHAGSESALVQVVRTLLAQPEARVPYIERARTYVRSKHSLGNIERLIRLINECAAPPAARQGSA